MIKIRIDLGTMKWLSSMDDHSVTKEKWEEIQELLKTLEEEKKSLEKDIRDAAQELDSLKTAVSFSPIRFIYSLLWIRPQIRT